MSTAGAASGKAYLIGAGPGAADLLTVRATRVLAAADVVLVDALVDRALLAHCRQDATILAVGRRAGCGGTPQAFVERLMLRYARAGCMVAHLKGGDPFVFGRGGEEYAFLRRHGIEVEVVPGITAGIAVPASFGIPVTQRGLARAVTLLTAHTADAEEPDWNALVRSRATLAIYMGLQRIAHVVACLLRAGLAPETPVAVISQGTSDNARAIRATAATIVAAVERAQLQAPALIVIGAVVGLAAEGTLPASQPVRAKRAQRNPKMEATQS